MQEYTGNQECPYSGGHGQEEQFHRLSLGSEPVGEASVLTLVGWATVLCLLWPKGGDLQESFPERLQLSRLELARFLVGGEDGRKTTIVPTYHLYSNSIFQSHKRKKSNESKKPLP